LPFLPFFLSPLPPPSSTLFPYTTLFRSAGASGSTAGSFSAASLNELRALRTVCWPALRTGSQRQPPSSLDLHMVPPPRRIRVRRSEEHTSELQSRENLVCRLLLEKKKNK